MSKEGFYADFDQRITRLRFAWVLKLTSQLWLIPDLPLLGGGQDNRRIQQGIENRGFLNQIKKFLQGKSKAPVSQLVNADDTSVIEIKTQHYLES